MLKLIVHLMLSRARMHPEFYVSSLFIVELADFSRPRCVFSFLVVGTTPTRHIVGISCALRKTGERSDRG